MAREASFVYLLFPGVGNSDCSGCLHGHNCTIQYDSYPKGYLLKHYGSIQADSAVIAASSYGVQAANTSDQKENLSVDTSTAEHVMEIPNDILLLHCLW